MNEEKFTSKADLYDKYRPSYPMALIDFLWDKTHAETVADIGAGTGIFTKCLCTKPWKVIAVEPNSDMSGILRANLSDVEIVNASAENTGIRSGSIGMVTAAQAFHWFNREQFARECKRILTPEGGVALVWNTRTVTDMQTERNQIFLRHTGVYDSVKGNHNGSDRFSPERYFSELTQIRFLNRMEMDCEQYIGCEMSRSYAPKKGTPVYEAMENDLVLLFQKYEQGGKVSIEYETECFLGKF
ncbi:MAG: class I SAM-dependent methyltransferase [Oscillospiraceae bacterium]|nr:class I SAM-dependent methyltransferase [Oscillospiraceae bacterium]